MRTYWIYSKILLVGALLAVFSTAALGADFSDTTKIQFEELSDLGVSYESGDINFLQLKVKAGVIGEKMRRAVSRGRFDVEVGEKKFEGISMESMERLFGKPTEMTDWIWLVNNEKSDRIDEPVPRWEFPVFNGEKIKITFNAWPQGLRDRDGNTFIFYWTGFEIWFKKKMDVDFEKIVLDATESVEDYYKTGAGKEELAEKLAGAQKSFRLLMDENSEQCKKVVGDVVGGEKEVVSIIAFDGKMFSGNNLILMLDSRICESCEDWKWADINVWVEPVSPEFFVEESEMVFGGGEFEEAPLSTLYTELEITLRNIVREAAAHDVINDPSFSARFGRLKNTLHSITQSINERVNDFEAGEEEKLRLIAERNSIFEDLLEKYSEKLTKENIKQFEQRRMLFTAKETETFSHCESKWEGCEGGKCLQEKGTPVCTESKDGDGDGDGGYRECGPTESPYCTDDIVRLCKGDDDWVGSSYCSCGVKNPEQLREEGWYDCDISCPVYSPLQCPDGNLVGGGVDPETGCNLPPVCETTTTVGKTNTTSGKTTTSTTSTTISSVTTTTAPTTTTLPSLGSFDLGYVKIDGDSLRVYYSKNFTTCAHLVDENLKITHNINVFCKSSSGFEFIGSNNDFNLSGDKKFKLCHGNNYNLCTKSVSLTYGSGVSGAFITGYQTANTTTTTKLGDKPAKGSLGEACGDDGGCASGKCRGERDGTGKKCSNGNAEDELCKSDWECESEMCEDGACVGGEPASWSCGNGFCENHEVSGGLNPCSEDCVKGVGTYTDDNGQDYKYGSGASSKCNYDGVCQSFNGEDSYSCRSDCFCGNGFCEENEDQFSCSTDCADQLEEDFSCRTRGCHQTQFCTNNEYGYDCECLPGKWDCDGEYELNGCESDQQCKPCQSDSDCATDRCSLDGWGIQRYGCVQDDSFENEVAGFEIHGGCAARQSGRTDSWIDFGMWGEKLDDVERLRRSLETDGFGEWCKNDFENALIERKELQNSFNEEFVDWLFEDFKNNPGDFELYGRSLGESYWALVENSRRIAESMQCLKKDGWPEEAVPVSLKMENEYGKIELEERFVETDFFGKRMKVLSPFMKMWMFPPKEAFKEFVKEDFKRGKFGPDGEERGGPSPAEVAMIKKNPQIMAMINSISDAFGGDAKLLFKVADDDETVFNMLITVNPDVIMDVRPVPDFEGEVSATMTADLDFFYDMISTFERDAREFHEESPPWVQQFGKENREEDRGPKGDDLATGIKMFTRLLGGVVSGEIRVEPIDAWVPVALSLRGILELMKIGAAFGG